MEPQLHWKRCWAEIAPGIHGDRNPQSVPYSMWNNKYYATFIDNQHKSTKAHLRVTTIL